MTDCYLQPCSWIEFTTLSAEKIQASIESQSNSCVKSRVSIASLGSFAKGCSTRRLGSKRCFSTYKILLTFWKWVVCAKPQVVPTIHCSHSSAGNNNFIGHRTLPGQFWKWLANFTLWSGMSKHYVPTNLNTVFKILYWIMLCSLKCQPSPPPNLQGEETADIADYYVMLINAQSDW